MKDKVDQFKALIFKRTPDTSSSELSLDIEMFNILWAVDGSRTVATIALEGCYDSKYLYSRLVELHRMHLIEIVKANQSTNLHPKTTILHSATKKKTTTKNVSHKKKGPKIEEDVVGYIRTMLSNDGFKWDS